MANIIVRVRMQKFFQYEASTEAEAIEKAKQEDLSDHIQFEVVNPKNVDTSEKIKVGSLSAPVEKLKLEGTPNPSEENEDEE